MTTPSGEHEDSLDCFGTRVRLLIGVRAAAPVTARLSALRVKAGLRGVHRALTRFNPASELSRLNARAGERVAVSPIMAAAIHAARAAARRSDGLVDPTILPELERAGYASSRVGATPADLAEAIAAAPPRRPAQARPTARWREIEVEPQRRIVQIPAGVRLDVGGTAKGLAVDLAAGMLADQPSFAVDAGGDIRLGGSESAPRMVKVAHPLDDGTAHEIELATGAIATSGLRTRLWSTPRGYAHHLIDPGRGEPAWTGVIQASALAPTALEAETLAKTALLRGPLAGLRVLARHGGALILDDGELLLAGPLAAPTSTPYALVT
jgi:thiamine biosynthesis lipoprotein